METLSAILKSDLSSQLAQLGVGGIFVILVLRLVFDFLKDRDKRRGNGQDTSSQFYEVVKDLLENTRQQNDLLEKLGEGVTQLLRQSEKTQKFVIRAEKSLDMRSH